MASPRAGIQPYLRSLAGWAWNRQNDALQHGLSLQEETLTEMLLLRIAHDCRPLGLRVRMFTRAQESRNGADWEWFVRGPRCSGIGYRVQAKRLFQKGRYKGKYGGHDPAGPQAGKLIAMAGSANFPIYVFYNNSSTTAFDTHSSAGFRGPSFWGCSYASATSVKDAGSRVPSDLIKHMRPWHELFDHCIRSAPQTSEPTAGSSRGRDGGQDGSPSAEEPQRDPQWVQMLNSPDEMEIYMEQQELAGVAYFDASNADFDWSVE